MRILIKNKKTGKLAVVYDYGDEGREAVIKYLKDDKPFGPLRTVQLLNFIGVPEPRKVGK